jgi:hypothetical protein
LASTIVFNNLFHRDTAVELRVAAPSFDCNQNPSLGSIIVPAQGQKPFPTSQSICFRRDVDPDNPTGQLTPFETINIDPPPAPPQVIEINI